MTASANGDRHRWVVTIGLFLFLAINFADKAMMGLAAGPIMRELHLSHARFGSIAASFFALFSLSAIVVGLLANRIQTRWLLLAMAVVWSLSQVPLLLVATPGMLILSRVLLGASEGPAYPVAVHALYKWFPDHERALPSTVLTIGSAFGAGGIAPLVTAVIVTFGWRAAFLSLAVVGLAWAVVWFSIGKEGPLDSLAHGSGARVETGSPAHVPLRTLLLSRTCLGGFLMGFAAYTVVTISVIWLPSYLVQVAGYSMQQVGWIVVLPSIGQMASAPLLGWWSQRLMRGGVSSRHARGTLGASAVAISGIALASMSVLPAGIGLIVAVTVAFGLGALVFAIGVTIVSEITPPGQRGGVLGINNCIVTMAGLVTPVVIGYVIDSAATPTDGYRAGMALIGAFAVVCSVVAACMINPASDRRRFAQLASGSPALPSGIGR